MISQAELETKGSGLGTIFRLPPTPHHTLKNHDVAGLKTREIAELVECVHSMGEMSSSLILVCTVPFDKIPSQFQNCYCLFHPKNTSQRANAQKEVGRVLNLRPQGKGLVVQRLCQENTGC